VLDAFTGSGTTLIAAERAGRRGFVLELEPRYVDVTLRRFRDLVGIEPLHAESGLTSRSSNVLGHRLRAQTRRTAQQTGRKGWRTTPDLMRQAHEQCEGTQS